MLIRKDPENNNPTANQPVDTFSGLDKLTSTMVRVVDPNCKPDDTVFRIAPGTLVPSNATFILGGYNIEAAGTTTDRSKLPPKPEIGPEGEIEVTMPTARLVVLGLDKIVNRLSLKDHHRKQAETLLAVLANITKPVLEQ